MGKKSKKNTPTPIRTPLPKISIPSPVALDLTRFFSVDLLSVSIPNNEAIVEIPTIFTFEFSKDPWEAGVITNVTFTIDEKEVVKTARTITKPLIPVQGTFQATVELIFPEALAGAKLSISYGIGSLLVRRNTIQSNIDIKRADGLEEIGKVYWSEHEHAKWGAELTVQKELCKNETGFLHIYTKGMFGKQVWCKYQGKGDGGTTYVLGTLNSAIMRDNVLSVPYAMSDALAKHNAAYLKDKKKDFSGNKIELHGFVSKTNPIKDFKNTEILNLLCNLNATNPQQSTVGTDVKVLITTDEEAIPTPTKAQCILEFRPDNTYIGDYGFDWVRMGDTGTPGYHHDHDFENHMGKHYYDYDFQDNNKKKLYRSINVVEHDGNNHGNQFQKDIDPNQPRIMPDYETTSQIPVTTGTGTSATTANYHLYINKNTTPDTTFGVGKMYKKLKNRYRRLIFNWNPISGNNDPFETYTPITTCLIGTDANGNVIPKTMKLDLHIKIKTKPDRIEFEFDNDEAKKYLNIKVPVSKKITTGLSSDTIEKMEIECIGEFDQEFTLKARAFKKDITDAAGNVQKDPKGEICGMLRILPNGQMYQTKVKIVIFNVKTNLNGNDSFGTNLVNMGKNTISKLFGQALIVPVFEDLDLDTTVDNDFKTNCSIKVKTSLPNTGSSGIPANEYALDRTKTGAIVTELEKKRVSEHGHTHDNAIRLYFVNELVPVKDQSGNWINGSAINGFSAPAIPGFTVCFGTMNSETPTHELGHTLGLMHTFDAVGKNTPFTYEYLKTNNLMDYGHNINVSRFNLMHWHWQTINSKIR